MPSKKRPQTKSGLPPMPVWMITAAIVILVSAAALIYFLSLRSRLLVQSPTPTPTKTADVTVEAAFLAYGSKGIFFLDVRPEKEWKSYRIDQSVNIPLTELSGRLGALPKTGTIVIFDASGGLPARQAYDILKQAGFSSIAWVQGGIQAWALKRYPVIGTAPY